MASAASDGDVSDVATPHLVNNEAFDMCEEELGVREIHRDASVHGQRHRLFAAPPPLSSKAPQNAGFSNPFDVDFRHDAESRNRKKDEDERTAYDRFAQRDADDVARVNDGASSGTKNAAPTSEAEGDLHRASELPEKKTETTNDTATGEAFRVFLPTASAPEIECEEKDDGRNRVVMSQKRDAEFRSDGIGTAKSIVAKSIENFGKRCRRRMYDERRHDEKYAKTFARGRTARVLLIMVFVVCALLAGAWLSRCVTQSVSAYRRFERGSVGIDFCEEDDGIGGILYDDLRVAREVEGGNLRDEEKDRSQYVLPLRHNGCDDANGVSRDVYDEAITPAPSVIEFRQIEPRSPSSSAEAFIRNFVNGVVRMCVRSVNR